MEPRFSSVPREEGRQNLKVLMRLGLIVLLGIVTLGSLVRAGTAWQSGDNTMSAVDVEKALPSFLRSGPSWAFQDASEVGVDDVNTENGASVQIEVHEASLDRAQEEEEEDEREMRELELAKRHDLWVEPKRLNVDEVCKRMFGNGYTNIVQICNGEKASMDCWYSPTSRGAVCEGSNLVLDPSLIAVAPGGEPASSVSGRDEAVEIPVYKKGALKMDCDLPKEAWDPEMLAPHLKLVMSSVASDIKGAATAQCTSWEEKPTLFVTRYEHADVYSAVADWYNTYQAQQQLADGEDVNLVFLDGHPQGPLDEAWSSLVGKRFRHVKSFSSPTCFRKAIFVPVGARGALSVTNFHEVASCKRVPQVRNFANAFVDRIIAGDKARTQLADASKRTKPLVLVFLRNPFRPAQVLKNEKEVIASLRGLDFADVRLEPFDGLSFRECVALVRGAQVIVGIHDAALSFILFGLPGTTLVELQMPEYKGLSYYDRLSQFVGAAHRVVSLPPPEEDSLHQLPPAKLTTAISDAVQVEVAI